MFFLILTMAEKQKAGKGNSQSRHPSNSRASSDPHYPPISFHTGNIFLPTTISSDFLQIKKQSDDNQVLLLIHYGGKFCTKIQNPHLQLFSPLLLSGPAAAISKSAKEGKLKLQSLCIFNHNHLGNSNLTEWMMQKTPASLSG